MTNGSCWTWGGRIGPIWIAVEICSSPGTDACTACTVQTSGGRSITRPTGQSKSRIFAVCALRRRRLRPRPSAGEGETWQNSHRTHEGGKGLTRPPRRNSVRPARLCGFAGSYENRLKTQAIRLSVEDSVDGVCPGTTAVGTYVVELSDCGRYWLTDASLLTRSSTATSPRREVSPLLIAAISSPLTSNCASAASGFALISPRNFSSSRARVISLTTPSRDMVCTSFPQGWGYSPSHSLLTRSSIWLPSCSCGRSPISARAAPRCGGGWIWDRSP